MKKIIREFLMDCEVAGLSQATLRLYEHALTDFAASLEKASLNEIEPRDIRAWIKGLGQRPGRSKGPETLSPASQRTYVAIAKRFFSWCVSEGLLKADQTPMANIRPPKAPRKVIPSLTKDHLMALLETWSSSRATDQRNRAMLIVLLDSGIRAGELLGLRLSDIDLERGCLRVNGKGGKQRLVPIGETTRNVLANYLEKTRPSLAKGNENGWIFLSQRGKRLEPAELSQIFRRAKRQAGIPDETPCSPHTLRHTAALQLIRNGVNAFAVQRILGHSDLNTTRIYVNQVFEDLQELHRRASPVEKMLGGSL